MNTTEYTSGASFDDQGYSDGWDNDVMRCADIDKYPFGKDPKSGTLEYSLGSAHMLGIQAVFADGSVRPISYTVTKDVLMALTTRNGNEVVSSDN